MKFLYTFDVLSKKGFNLIEANEIDEAKEILSKMGFAPFVVGSCAEVKESYKGYLICEIDNCFIVFNPEQNTRFFVGLDDSKTTGKRVFNEDANNTVAAKNYIDWVSERKKEVGQIFICKIKK